MRKLGLLLLLIGFFGAAFVSVREADRDRDGNRREWSAIQWPYYVGAMAVGVVGVVLLRITARRAAAHSEKAAANLRTAITALDQLNAAVQRLRSQREQIMVYDLSGRIESEMMEDLARFADARETLIPLFGLQAYANIMNSFAGAERNINRAWCASADGYVDEAWSCMDRAAELFAAARHELATHAQSLDRASGAFA